MNTYTLSVVLLFILFPTVKVKSKIISFGSSQIAASVLTNAANDKLSDLFLAV